MIMTIYVTLDVVGDIYPTILKYNSWHVHPATHANQLKSLQRIKMQTHKRQVRNQVRIATPYLPQKEHR